MSDMANIWPFLQYKYFLLFIIEAEMAIDKPF